MRTRGMQSRPQNSSIVAKLSIAGLVSINAHGRIPCAAAKCSHSGNRTAIFILTSYAFRQGTKQRRRWRPTKLITACTTPRAPLPNMDSLFQPRKSHCQNIARSMFHNLSNPFRLV